MMEQISKRLSLLQNTMSDLGIAACIIPGTDPHASEYIADHWKEREWISGFDGSAGTAALTTTKAGIWTDSRYFLQGAEQLQGTGFELMKQGLPETLEIIPWLANELKTGDKVGVNGQMFSVNQYQNMKNELEMSGIELVDIDLISKVWTDRPALPAKEFFVFDEKYNGQAAAKKIEALQSELKKLKANAMVLSSLDDIAWLLNIRGNDVDYNPVVIAYVFVDESGATLFIDPVKITAESAAYLTQQGIKSDSYTAIYKKLNTLDNNAIVVIDGAKLNRSLYEAIPAQCAKRNVMSPVFKMKSIKNATEIAGIRNAMIKDGVALTKFFMWLENNVENETLSEVSISEKLYTCRAEQDLFMGESFGSIAGYASHGAIVHYHATPATDAKLKPDGILLLDSGGQYLDGTTDITRTIALGEPTKEQQEDFTLVLKGHIALTTAFFPYGTRGSQLDILARKAMWDRGLNYGHGTGHGIGHFLNVHEGPQSIRMDENPTILQPGMILSNEPGMYRANEYGIRIENLVLVSPAMSTEFGQFLRFETLTLFPIDINLIDIDLIDMEEITWLEDYHNMVYQTLAPHLNVDEKEWLKNKCRSLDEFYF